MKNSRATDTENTGRENRLDIDCGLQFEMIYIDNVNNNKTLKIFIP